MADSAPHPTPHTDESAASKDSNGAARPSLTNKPGGIHFRTSFQHRGSISNKYSAAIDVVNSARKEENMTRIDEIRMNLKKSLAGSWWGRLYENWIMITSVFSTFEYIYQTYLTETRRGNQYDVAQLVEMGFAAIFAFDWLLNLFLADQTFTFLFSFFSLIDIFTVTSMGAAHFIDPVPYGVVHTWKDVLIYITYGFKTVRILRCLWFNKILSRIEDAIDRYLAEMSLSISTMILFFSAVVQYLEEATQPFPFHTWMYYIWVTIATVGYGDITPHTTAGRVMVMIMIGVAIVSIPKMTNELIDKMSLQSVYMRAVYSPRTRNSKHVIICGDLSSTSLREFFEELFHEDHENTELSAVILLPQPPTIELILLMRHPQFVLSLNYLEGSALLEADLIRAKAESAMAIFIMTNKFSANPDEEDAKSILLSLSIKRYLAAFDRSKMLYCMQLIRPENRRHLASDDFNGLDDHDLVVCLNEIKMGAMAKAVMYPGANTLLMNLVSSFADEDLQGEMDDSKVTSVAHIDPEGNVVATVEPKAWMKEYMKGCGWEIYTTMLSKLFVGAKFAELSFALYDKIGVVLFALQVTDVATGQSKLLLNPHDYIIPDQEKYQIEAFVIATNKASSDLSFEQQSRQSAVQTMNKNIGSVASIVKSSVVDYRNSADNDRRRRQTRKFLLTVAQQQNKEDGESSSVSNNAAEGQKKSHWSSLKRSSLLKKKVEQYSYQEVLHRLEDKHFMENYYIREPVELKACTVKTSVLDELPFIQNHLIIIGKSLKNLYDLIRPLRAKYLGALRYIVIVHAEDIPHDVWQRIAVFDAILFVRGSPLEESHLRRAGIFRAAQVVVLADGTAGTMAAHGTEALVDSDAIFAYQHVKRMNPSTQVVLEIVNQTNISYLEADQSNLSSDYKFSTQFSSGILFTTALLDSIICQAYYNPQIIKVMNKLISGVDQTERMDLAAEAVQQIYLNGDESDENRVKYQKTLSPITELKGSCLYQIALPEGLEKKTYGALYKHLSQQGIIPLGLFRGVFAHLNMGPKANRFPYVYTNPDKDTELYSCDRVFVLSPKPIEIVGPANVKEWIMDIQMQQQVKKESLPSGSRGPSTPHSRDPSTEKQLHKLNYRMDRLYKDVQQQFGELRELLGAPKRKQESDAANNNSADEDGRIRSGSSTPGIPTSAFSVITRARNDSDYVYDELQLRKTDFSKQSSPTQTSAKSAGGILKNSILATDQNVKQRSSFSEPPVSSIAVFSVEETKMEDPSIKPPFVEQIVKAQSIQSEEESSDADSRCTEVDHEAEEKNCEKELLLNPELVEEPVQLSLAFVSVQTAPKLSEEAALDVSSISESDMVKDFEVKVKPTPAPASMATAKVTLTEEQHAGDTVVKEEVAGPSLQQITQPRSRMLNESKETPSFDSSGILSKSAPLNIPKVPRAGVEQAFKSSGPPSTNANFHSKFVPRSFDSASLYDDNASIMSFPDDDCSIVSVDSKSVPPGPTLDMIYRPKKRRVRSDKY